MFQKYEIKVVDDTLVPTALIVDDILYVTIFDSDFTEDFPCTTDQFLIEGFMVEQIIRVYSEKQLDVAKNLFLYMKYLEKEIHSSMTINRQIDNLKSINDDFEKLYLPEIRKYLLFN